MKTHRPDWVAKRAAAISRAVVSTHPETGDEFPFPSLKMAAEWASKGTGASGNISKAIRSGALSYSFHWRKATPLPIPEELA